MSAFGISYPPIPIFEVGPLRLSLHGLFAAVGFALGAWLLMRLVRQRELPEADVSSALTWALIGALVGARYLTVPAQLLEGGSIVSALSPLGGSFSILGGFAGGIGAAWWRLHHLDVPFIPIADLAAPPLALGTVVGRLGDLAIVEHLGSPTSFPLGFTVRGGYDLAPAHNALECLPVGAVCGTYHHTALYDLLGAAVLFALVWLMLRRRWRPGTVFAVWMGWYGLQRFAIDFTRIGNEMDQMAGPITWSQLVGLTAGLTAAGWLAWQTWRRRSVPAATTEPALGKGPP
ncbi:MAG: prolipoprotein diacylglyceryl transferase [Acidimicrobiia bacterium]